MSAVILQMVQQNDDKHEAGHTRLRLDYREIEKRVFALERAYTDTALEFTRIKVKSDAPIDGMQIKLSVRQWAAITMGILAVAGAAWSSAAWVKSDVQALRGEFALETRLTDERNQSMMKSIDDLRKRQELLEIEVRNKNRGR